MKKVRLDWIYPYIRISDPQWKVGEKMQVLVLNIMIVLVVTDIMRWGISQPIQHLKIVFFLTLHAPHPLTLGPTVNHPRLPRQWAVDTAKEIYRFIHEKSRLREEVEKHNKDRQSIVAIGWCCTVFSSISLLSNACDVVWLC